MKLWKLGQEEKYWGHLFCGMGSAEQWALDEDNLEIRIFLNLHQPTLQPTHTISSIKQSDLLKQNLIKKEHAPSQPQPEMKYWPFKPVLC